METKKHCVGDIWLTKNKECPHQMVVNSTIYKYCGRHIYDICFKEHEYHITNNVRRTRSRNHIWNQNMKWDRNTAVAGIYFWIMLSSDVLVVIITWNILPRIQSTRWCKVELIQKGTKFFDKFFQLELTSYSYSSSLNRIIANLEL